MRPPRPHPDRARPHVPMLPKVDETGPKPGGRVRSNSANVGQRFAKDLDTSFDRNREHLAEQGPNVDDFVPRSAEITQTWLKFGQLCPSGLKPTLVPPFHHNNRERKPCKPRPAASADWTLYWGEHGGVVLHRHPCQLAPRRVVLRCLLPRSLGDPVCMERFLQGTSRLVALDAVAKSSP